MANLFDKIGGDTLRLVLEDFYDRVLADDMIGFLFKNLNRERLVQKEWELTARMLGADIRYTGKPLGEAHARHRILGGQFARRQKLLEEVLVAHNIDAEVQRFWLDHTAKLRSQITRDDPTECND